MPRLRSTICNHLTAPPPRFPTGAPTAHLTRIATTQRTESTEPRTPSCSIVTSRGSGTPLIAQRWRQGARKLWISSASTLLFDHQLFFCSTWAALRRRVIAVGFSQLHRPALQWLWAANLPCGFHIYFPQVISSQVSRECSLSDRLHPVSSLTRSFRITQSPQNTHGSYRESQSW